MIKKYIQNAGKPWTVQEIEKLKDFSKQNTPTRVIGLRLGRPIGGIRNKASEINISLKPTNQSPYNRRKK